MEILITGATGLLARHLIAALRQRGHRLRALVLPGEPTAALEAADIRVYQGDIRLLETLAAPMDGVDWVFHLAGMMGVWLPIAAYRAVNVTGAENVCRAALAAHVRRLVHVSSWTVYGMDLGRPAQEDFPLTPFPEPYAVTKAEGDHLVRSLMAREGLPAVVVRPGTFFGPGDRLHFARMADRVRKGSGVIVGRGANALPFVYVTDVVQGLVLAAERERAVGEAFNITNDDPMSQEAFLDAIAEELGTRRPRLHVPYRALYAAATVAERAATLHRARRQPVVTRLGVKLFGTDNRHSIDKARRLLGYRPQVTIREGVRLAAAWYRGHAEQEAAPAPTAPQEVTV